MWHLQRDWHRLMLLGLLPHCDADSGYEAVQRCAETVIACHEAGDPIVHPESLHSMLSWLSSHGPHIADYYTEIWLTPDT